MTGLSDHNPVSPIPQEKRGEDPAEEDRLLSTERALRSRGHTLIAGIDEAGRGPLAGPVVASAVVFPALVFIPGVKDSKKLTPVKRERLYEEIMQLAVSVGIGRVDEAEIDRINILSATYEAMKLALQSLLVSPSFLLVDGFAIPDCPVDQQGVIRGDASCFSIAAASIVAKVTRDRIMQEYDRQYPEYGFARHKGYPTALHRTALRQYGPCRIHRRSFSWK